MGFKTLDGRWAEKQVYIGPYVEGPEGAPLVVTKKVNDLSLGELFVEAG